MKILIYFYLINECNLFNVHRSMNFIGSRAKLVNPEVHLNFARDPMLFIHCSSMNVK